jgi:hypothetical protein
MESARNNNKRIFIYQAKRALYIMLALAIMISGCTKDDGKAFNRDNTIPDNPSWDINTVLDLNTVVTNEGDDPYIEPKIAVTHDDQRVYITWFRANDDPATSTDYPYRIMYRSFLISDLYYLNGSNTTDETVTLLENDARNIADLSIAIAGGKPVVAYSVYKEFIHLPDSDLNNQGDVMIAVRDGANDWRIEIGAYGYVAPDRNPVFTDGLAQSDFCVKGDDDGNVLLSFQFYYEGIDSYNYDYPDLRYIRQPVDAFLTTSVYAVADDEETIQGNAYQNNASGQQSFNGGSNDLVLDLDGNPAVFYYNDNSVNGPAQDRGLKVGRRVTNDQGVSSWETEYIESGIDVVDIKGTVTSDGRLMAVYAVKDLPDFIDPQVELPYVIKLAEEIDVVTGVDDDGEDIVVRQWHTEFVNYNTISGRFCTLALDSNDQPVAAFFDEMNFTGNRFFSRVKISSRNPEGAWDVDVIDPEDVGLSNSTSPYDITPGLHDKYYIGKYNHLWIDGSGRTLLASYSTVSRKLYLFVQR